MPMRNAIALRNFHSDGRKYRKGQLFRIEENQLDDWAGVGLVRPQRRVRK